MNEIGGKTMFFFFVANKIKRLKMFKDDHSSTKLKGMKDRFYNLRVILTHVFK